MYFVTIIFCTLLVGLSHQCIPIPGSETCTGFRGRETIDTLLGGSARIGNMMDGRLGRDVPSASSLNCPFGGLCKWGSDGPGENKWYKVSGVPNSQLWQTYTGTSVVPSDFAIHAKQAGKASDWLMSDNVGCQRSGGRLDFRYWLMNPASFQICQIPVMGDRNQPLYCTPVVSRGAPLNPGTPNPTGVTLPDQSEPFKIAFIPVADGGFVAVDDVSYSAGGVSCNGLQNDGGGCKDVECDFNPGRACKWTDADATMGATNSFRPSTGAIGNPTTGVKRGPPGGSSYAGVQMAPMGQNGAGGDVAILQSSDLILTKPQTMRIKYYEAVNGQQLKVAANNPSNVIWSSLLGIAAKDLNWQSADIPIPASVQKLFLIAENTGNSFGGIGVDDIQLFDTATNARCA